MLSIEAPPNQEVVIRSAVLTKMCPNEHEIAFVILSEAKNTVGIDHV
jgi:hypothetical protein